MPSELIEAVRSKPDSAFTTFEKWMVVGLAIILCFGMGTLALYVGSIKTDIANGKIRGYKNRSVECSVLATQIGAKELPETCLEAPVVEFYKPAVMEELGSEEDSQALKRVLCTIELPAAVRPFEFCESK